MPRVGDNVYFTELGMVGWWHLTWLLSFFQIMGIYPLLVFVSSVHSALGNRAANLNRRQKRSRQYVVIMSRTYTQMPRQGVWQNPRAERQWRHPVSLGLIPFPCTFHLAVMTFDTWETGGFAVSMGQCEQKEQRSAGQWLLRGKP